MKHEVSKIRNCSSSDSKSRGELDHKKSESKRASAEESKEDEGESTPAGSCLYIVVFKEGNVVRVQILRNVHIIST